MKGNHMSEPVSNLDINKNKSPVPLSEIEIRELSTQTPGWEVVMVNDIPRLRRAFKFKNFIEALEFTNKVGDIAEEHGHHPLIELTWGRVTIDWWSHDLQGLHQNDFLMAEKTSKLYQT
jgi:4a-hydroxytetrahydrobiopterin dehydratase